MACFDGQYPIELPAGNLIGKHLLEGVGKRAVDAGRDLAAAAAAAAGLEPELEAELVDEPASGTPAPSVVPAAGRPASPVTGSAPVTLAQAAPDAAPRADALRGEP